MNAAREKVRLANALGELPKISASFARDEISYSKVRAMTRVATAEEEDKAVEDRLRKRAAGEEYADPDVSGEFEDEHVPFDHRRADALTNMAESYLANGPAASSSADRYQVVLHVSAETARRICCDAGISVLSKDEDGTILNIGRKSRIIPPAMCRALKARDENCRFPGCTHKYYIDGHHVKHWSDGGETSLDNLVLICRHHHRLVHEGGFSCTKNSEGKIEFRNPQGILIARAGLMPVLPLNFDLTDRMRNRYEDLYIDANTCVSKYDDARIDWDLAVGHMFH